MEDVKHTKRKSAQYEVTCITALLFVSKHVYEVIGIAKVVFQGLGRQV